MAKKTQDLILLTSPPASGKTYWITSLIREVGEADVLVVSPLRALANECQLLWGEQVTVVTPEEWQTRAVVKPIVIFDEFHLYFYWGDSFRPRMWEAFYELATQAELTVLLTATLSETMKNEIRLFTTQFDQILWNDLGNQTLKYFPTKYLKVPGPQFMSELISLQKPGSSTSLLFCAYREEVFGWARRLEALGFKVWTCVGGEAASFSQKVQFESPPDFIVATTVLSHGVNLPTVSTIYFLYQVKNIDFWIQMVARGGRRGEDYRVFALENPHGIKWNRWINDLAILVLSLKIKRHKLKRQWYQCFLKDSSSTKFPIKREI